MKNRLYVGNLSFDTTEQALQSAFAEFGEVSEVKVISDRESGRSRGFAFVVMSNGEQAQRAMERMNGALVNGRALKVSEAEERSEGGSGSRGGNGSQKRNRW